ncbi:MAG: NYN domain-containing protein [Candidatus Omnitrophica bacterium]|nr:NYN domain-containing protein [Candidatus Omnitrophota bacterium]
MSLHFLLDGYNIIKQTSSLNQGTLQSQRQALVNWIHHSAPQGSIQNGVTIVFDGKEEFFGSHESSSVRVIFTAGESADDLIKRIVEQYPAKKSLVVVSNDKDIKLYVRALGAAVLSVKEFMRTALEKKHQSSQWGSKEATSKYISLTDQARINKEFERIWIKKN